MNDKIYTRNRFRFGNKKNEYPRQTHINLENRAKVKVSSNAPTFIDKNKQRKKQNLIKLIIVLVIAFTFAYFSLKGIEPIMRQNCISMSKSIATKICNNEATEVMKKYSYNDLMEINKDEKGNIKMIGTNIITVNEIISDIPVHIQEEIEKAENSNFSIPLGSFLGSNLFSGQGPKVPIKMQLTGDIDTDLRSEFTEARN